MDRQETADPKQTATVSPALAAAQQKLDSLRRANRLNQTERPTPTGEIIKNGRSQNQNPPKTHQPRPNFLSLPNHLGWHSAPTAKAYRLALANQKKKQTKDQPLTIQPTLQPRPTPQPDASTISQPSLTLAPDIALAILRNKLAAPGRIWLLLRHLDKDGKGWLSADLARKRLTHQPSPFAVCGERQLRNLLAAGDKIFWERDNQRIWLKSMAKVAAVLGLSRLNGRPVKLPISILLESIGSVRSHLYATFHSSRNGRDDSTNGRKSKPISRKTLKNLSAVPRRTQRLYEKRTGVRRQRNYAVGQPQSIEAQQNAAWQHGQAVFQFNDHKGLLGKTGETYLAWQLPNSYDGPHDVQSKSARRRINRQLADLLNKGITGNGEEKIETHQTAFRTPIFHRNSSTAAKIYNRTPDQDLYWQSRAHRGRFTLWHALPARSGESRP